MADKIGRYEIIRELGRGGMATVYLAYDPRFEREVAVKVLPRQFTHDPKFLTRFEQEAKLIAALEDPAIVPVYDFGEQDDAPYLVMRYMPAGSLRDQIGGRPLSLDHCAAILSRLAPALDTAHQKGIIHRDIKPDNILFDDAGRPFLADFGIARLAEATQTMTVVGTPSYMSPEQVRGKEKLDWRVDLYALGVMLFEMLSGKRPYDADTPSGQMFMHVMEPVPDLLSINPELPPQAQEVIEKAMAKDRQERFQSAQEMAAAVAHLLEFSGASASMQPDQPPAIAPFEAVRSEGTAPPPRGHKPSPTVPDTPPELRGPVAKVQQPAAVKGAEGGSRSFALPGWIWWITAVVLLLVIVLSIRAAFFSPETGEGTKVSPRSTSPALNMTQSAAAISSTARPSRAAPTPEAGGPAPEAAPALAAGSLECSDALGCVVIAPGDPILLASALVISGPNSELGLDSQRGIELAIDFRDQVLGHPLALQVEDDGCSAEGGRASARKIVSNPQVIAMIGTSCSTSAIPAAKIVSDAGYAMVSPSNTSPALTDPALAFQAGYLRTAHNDLVQGRAMAEFAINELGVTKAAAIHEGDPYTEDLVKAFGSAFMELGGAIVAVEKEAPDAGSVELLLQKIAAAGPEFIFYPVFIPLGSLITNTARDIPGLEGVILAAADGLQSPSFLENTAGTSEGMYVSGPDLAFANTFYQDEFLPAYIEKYGIEPTAPFHAHAFDAANMILNAVEKTAQQSGDGTLLIGRQALRDALYATRGMQGITGMISCNEFGDCADAQISVSQVQNNAFVRVWP